MARKAKAVDFLVNRMSKMRIKDEAIALASDVKEDVSDDTVERQPFRFFDLPYELRMRVYEFLLIFPKTIDLDPTNYRIVAPHLRLFLVDHRMHEEASRIFYGRNTFRVFPIHGRYINRKHPLLAWLPRKYRVHITRLELRLGPGFTRPPKGWVVDSRLGLAAATKLYKLKVFVEIDPASNEIFEGFRVGQNFYTEYCVNLLRGLLTQVSSINEVEFDAYPSVSRSSPLLEGLLEETKLNQKRITWGPERGWDKIVEVDLANVLQKLGLGTR
ncbi:Nn.00g011370.m01.CDS01 [Neocucurbitaria sp. VM-36]